MTSFKFSQLTRDILTASTATIGWRNSLVPVNRLPLDVLCLIPLHLAFLSDRLRVTFVCRHWRRTFLQHAAIWSQLHVTGKTDRLLAKTLLERAKGHPLDITANYFMSPVHDVALLSPFVQQTRSLCLKGTSSDKVQELSASISGPLPLLHTLEIDTTGYLDDPPSLVVPPLPLFKNAANLKNFVLAIDELPSLCHFTFPNLTTLNFSTWAGPNVFPVSYLVDFLEASPSLQRIRLLLQAFSLHEDVPPERVVVLPCVETFYLGITNDSPGCEIAPHISCPSANHAEFLYMLDGAGWDIPEGIYPPSNPWSMIARQYAKGMVEQVVLKTTMDKDFTIDCSIAFWSSDRAALILRHIYHSIEDEDPVDWILKERFPDVLSQAFRAIRDHPLLANVRYFCIRGGDLVTGDLKLATNDVGRLFGSMGPLEMLTLDGCDLRPYLDAFLDTPQFPDAIQPASFPFIKKLVIVNPVQPFCHFPDGKAYAAAIVQFARSQYSRGVPFECMALRTSVPSLVVEKLVLWVNTVEYEEAPLDGHEGEDEDEDEGEDEGED